MARLRLALVALIVCALAALAGVLLAPRPQADDAGTASASTGWAGALRPAGTVLPAFTLRDQDGRAVPSAALKGRGPVVVAFVYSHCEDTCPIEVQTIRGALDSLGAKGDDVRVVGISVDPAGDTARSARAFVLEQHMTGRMSFLMGSRAQLEPVWKAFGIQPQEGEEDHSASVVVLDAKGRQRVGFLYQYLTSSGLAHDLARLLA